jgi:hypothetical protein
MEKIDLGFLAIGEIFKHGWEQEHARKEINLDEIKADDLVLSHSKVVLNIGGYPESNVKEVESKSNAGFTRCELAELLARFHIECAKEDNKDEDDQFSIPNGVLDDIDVDSSKTPPVVYSYPDY